MTNTAKLKGRIVESGYNLSSFAEAMNMTRPTIRKRINGQAEFKASEINRVCDLLKIPKKEINNYFFCG